MIDMQTGEGLGILENALSHLQCIFIARRARDMPEMLSWAQYDILEILRLQDPMTPSFLGGRLGGARTGISKTLRVLKDLKLVEQMPGEGDRREQITALTQQGRDYLECAATFRRDAA
ncbi:MarR family winged helix-turn-helix transcriptional regulator [Klebsiella pneumoniae]|uniref:MarR family winged helix-turn-helix transcriptional regulator n=1 Tax=Klebsiella pneumoniae TaxID=573 RepID=UPI000B6877B3|nr:MarR family transcriptional regulator [Klebsiella pneumoniae]OUH91031.1 hypothetical protein AZZ68_004924 [Klebsiella pneumoniae]